VIEPGLSLAVEVGQALLLGKQTGAPLCPLPFEETRWERTQRRLLTAAAALGLLAAVAAWQSRKAAKAAKQRARDAPYPPDSDWAGGSGGSRLRRRPSLRETLTEGRDRLRELVQDIVTQQLGEQRAQSPHERGGGADGPDGQLLAEFAEAVAAGLAQQQQQLVLQQQQQQQQQTVQAPMADYNGDAASADIVGGDTGGQLYMSQK
jgi:hypothetical protein